MSENDVVKTVFSIERTCSANFNNLCIDLFGIIQYHWSELGIWNRDTDQPRVLLHWMSNADTKQNWTGFSIDLHDDDVERIAESAALCKKIFKGLGETASPLDAIKALRKAGIEQRQFDPRVDSYLPLDEIKGPEYRAYRDATISDRSVVGCIASCPSEARRELTKQFAETQRYHELQEWLLAEMPIREIDSWLYAAPSTAAAEDLVNFSD